MNEKQRKYVEEKATYWKQKSEKIAKEMAESLGYSLTAPVDMGMAKLFMISQEAYFDWRDLEDMKGEK